MEMPTLKGERGSESNDSIGIMVRETKTKIKWKEEQIP